MRDMKLVEASVVTDDDTGIWSIGEMEYGVPGTTVPWLESDPGNRKKLAEWLRMLADNCEAKKAPFEHHDASPVHEAQ